MQRDFKGIWIPKEIWLNKELKIMEKLFLVEIDSLDFGEDGCFASNDYFATFFDLSKNRCSEIIKSLENKGLISIEYSYKANSKAIDKRIIKVIGKSNTPIRKTDRPIRKTDRGYSEKCEDNNTIYNNTINNIYTDVINYLNFKASKNFRTNTTKTKSLIDARTNEGFTLEDFKTVIDVKCSSWLGTDYEKFLRPETLFSNKFEGYLNEKPKKATKPTTEKATVIVDDDYINKVEGF